MGQSDVRAAACAGVAAFLAAAGAFLFEDPSARADQILTPLLFVAVAGAGWFGGRSLGLTAAVIAVALRLVVPVVTGGDLNRDPLSGLAPTDIIHAAALFLAGLITGGLRDARERAEVSLRERDARLRVVSGQIPAILWSTDTELRLTTGMGSGGVAAIEAQREGPPFTAATFLEFVNASGPESPARRAHQNALLGIPSTYEIEWRDRAFQSHVEPLRSAEGEIIGVVGVALDITDRKNAERRLHEAKELAETATRAKDKFLAMLSHELRTPLTPALAATSALQSGAELPTAARDDVEMIRRNIELEVRLIDDLLDLTRISKGKMAMRFRTEDAHQLLQGALDICREEITAKRLLVTLTTPALRHHVRADGARLRQVFWNLLKNSVKFTPAGGEIRVSTSEGENGWLRVEVTDTGAGIDAEVLPHIFDAFKQGGATVTDSHGGLGLGLAISKALVEAHDGRLVAESAGRHHGATFRVELPTVEPDPIEAPVERNRGGSRLSAVEEPGTYRHRPLRILLVEDHRDTAVMLRRLLSSAGHTVRTAGTVRAALQAAEGEPVDVLVSDLGLPDGSGFDLMRELKQRRGPMKAIALSGFGMDSDVEKSREAGFERHITKPVDFRVLEDAIEEVAS